MERNLEIITAKLNPAQKKAVETLDGPLLCLAGAGSGKTGVLTRRVANLIATGRAAPEEILAVTFTNKAAREMESRIFKLLADIGIPVREPLWISTFHSFCTRVLRNHIELLDYKKFFTIYDDSDQLSQIKKVMAALQINEKTSPAKSYRNRINSAKMLGLGPTEVEKSTHLFLDAKSIEVYRMYEQEMKKANALDFGDLLMKVHELFRMYPAVLEEYQNQFKYVMVDEYQDTNHIQYLLVKMLAQKNRNLCVVGDEDQSIYSWRGADIRNILDFEKDFPEAQTIKLEENYRSTQNIVKAATAVIKHNTQRKDKTLFTSNPPGDLIQVREERSEYDEARFIAKKILGMVNEGEGALSDFAIFYRTNAQSRVLEEQLRTNSIPHQLVGGVRFYERMEIKDVLCYMKLSVNPADDMAFKRIVNVPTRGIGKTTLDRLEELSIEKKLSLLETTQWAVLNREFNAGTTSKLRVFLDLITDMQAHVHDYNMVEFYQLLLDKTGYLQKLKVENSVESEARIENLEELSNALMQFTKERQDATMQDFLEEMALVSDVDAMNDEQNGVTLMTLHVSKGLEYPYVFVVGMEENLFPSNRGDDDDEESELEEERRLAYVGMTRARQKLFLTYARSRKVWGQEQYNPPSRFLKEIPNELVNFTTSFETPKFVSKYSNSSSTPSKPIRKYDEDESQSFPDYEGQSSSEYQKGMKVRHPTFGAGTIFQVEGVGDQTKVSVLFSDQTIKKFVAKYARLERF
ncbi:MAG: DNA helicase [Oligoflexia bacterium]|nr:MAG: DNA helicase [Oligoflexia bacterium]